MKRIIILGSTGSIGQQTLDVLRRFRDRAQVVGLAGGRNTTLLEKQIAEFGPEMACSAAEGGLAGASGVEVVSLVEMVSRQGVDLVLVATSGKAGLEPTLAAIRSKKQVALANKEVLVMAGAIVMGEARRHGVEVLPVDSEHSAIWQCLRGEEGNGIRRLILTASGGPFRSRSKEELARVTPEQALAHPTWQMGSKVTVDSATLMNKGMEIIEAHWLFGVPYDEIEVIIHRQSIIHSMVEFVDGSIKAQMSLPDMRLPIQHALSYPERWQSDYHRDLDFRQVANLDFEEVDMQRFPCLRLAMEAGRKGGTYPAVASAADEVAVELFLDKRIGFADIPKLIENTLSAHGGTDNPSLDHILAADAWARDAARSAATH